MAEPQQAYLRLIERVRTAAEEEAGPRSLIDRAAGLLAGRVGCPVREAHVHLLRIAEEQDRDPARVATDVLALLETASAGDDRRVRSAVDEALGGRRRSRRARRHAEEAAPPSTAVVQHLLDAMPGAHSWLVPERDAAGEIVDFVTAAASPEAVDITGRQGLQMIGLRVREAYPGVVDGTLWQLYRQTLADGSPRALDELRYLGGEGVPAQATYGLRVHRLGNGLLVSWVRHDEAAREGERISQMERLGNFGWGEWDLVTGETSWSDQLYRIYERDPAEGPLGSDETNALVLPEDEPLRLQAAEMFANGEPVDVTYRIRVGGRVKHVRAVVEAVQDGTGRTLKIYGILQDVTARETARARLVDVERQLREHQQSLAAEHRLAAQLQQIILPIPEQPIDLPGLRVAVRYLPAERASRVGGDWYHAATMSDGAVLLAIGDVAGHGLHAATTMAQLRHALAALTVTTTDPAVLLSHLNRLLCASTAAASTATAVVARYEPATRRLVWAQAGHPPLLHVRAGETTELPRPRGPLLGAADTARYETAETTMERDDLLLLYTDGLVEHRDRSLREGLAPVIATLNRISAARRPQPLATLLAELRRANPDDDTCVVAARPLDPPEAAP
jgi:serine phosphatase RsbU (regulator of sigma subunit)